MLGQKNYCWIWIAVDRHGKKFIDCVTGARDTLTGQKLWGSLGGVLNHANQITADTKQSIA